MCSYVNRISCYIVKGKSEYRLPSTSSINNHTTQELSKHCQENSSEMVILEGKKGFNS